MNLHRVRRKSEHSGSSSHITRYASPSATRAAGMVDKRLWLLISACGCLLRPSPTTPSAHAEYAATVVSAVAVPAHQSAVPSFARGAGSRTHAFTNNYILKNITVDL